MCSINLLKYGVDQRLFQKKVKYGSASCFAFNDNKNQLFQINQGFLLQTSKTYGWLKFNVFKFMVD